MMTSANDCRPRLNTAVLKRRVIVSGCGACRSPSRTALRGRGSRSRSRDAPVEHLDLHPERGEGEGVERQDVLGVLGLAVRLDDLAFDDTGHLDGERPGGHVEQIVASACQLAPPHA